MTADGSVSTKLASVTRGLDPRVHRSSQEAFYESDGLPGQARQ